MAIHNGVPESEKLRAQLEEALEQLSELRERVAGLEQLASLSGSESRPIAAANAGAVHAPAATPTAATSSGITEDEVLAISAAVAAWLGVQAHIRQIRLIRTGAWSQQGRVTIQTSHKLNY